MTKIIVITPHFAVTGAIGPHDFAEISELGYRTVIGNRTEGEVSAPLAASKLAAAAADEGVHYAHVPATKFELFTEPVVSAMAQAIEAAEGPVLAHCASGQRSAIIWAAAQVRHRPVNDVLEDLRKAGLKLDFIRDDLEAQADRTRWDTLGGASIREPAPQGIDELHAGQAAAA